MLRNGFAESRDPILQPLDTIECRDAVLTPDGQEPDWPEADVVIGNPPFLGGKLLLSNLGGDTYTAICAGLRRPLPAKPIWSATGSTRQAGLSPRAKSLAPAWSPPTPFAADATGGAGPHRRARRDLRRLVGRAMGDRRRGRAVSLMCFAAPRTDPGLPMRLNGEEPSTHQRRSDGARSGAGSTSRGPANWLRTPASRSWATKKGGPFDIPGDKAREWLRLPANPNGRPNSDVLKPWVNGMDLTRRPAGKWIVDFGADHVEADAALYEEPFAYAREHVWPMRQNRARRAPETIGGGTSRLARACGGRWTACRATSSRRASPSTGCSSGATHRVCPDSATIVIARDDDTTFGILHSRFHELWSLRLGTWLWKRPALHAHHHLRHVPVSRGADARRSRRRLRQRPARRRHRRGRPPPGRAARPLAQPARMGRVDRRTRPRLPQAPRPNRHRRPPATQAPHPHQPLQPAPPMASQRPRHPRHRRRRRLRLGRPRSQTTTRCGNCWSSIWREPVDGPSQKTATVASFHVNATPTGIISGPLG